VGLERCGVGELWMMVWRARRHGGDEAVLGLESWSVGVDDGSGEVLVEMRQLVVWRVVGFGEVLVWRVAEAGELEQ
jgi:hypothetical protein